jgi:hypothetical protein
MEQQDNNDLARMMLKRYPKRSEPSEASIKNKARNELIMELHNQNMNLKEIGEYVGLTREGVRLIIKANGGNSKSVKDKKYKAIMYNFLAVIGNDIKEKEVLGNIPKKYFVVWIKNKYGIVIHEIYREKRKNKIIELNKEGKNAKEISDALGCSRAVILHTLHDANIYTLLTHEETKRRNDKIKELYFIKKMDRQELAEMFNTSYANIGLIVTDKHYIKYSPEYYAARHKRREETKKRIEEYAKIEEMIIVLFKEHTTLQRIATIIGEISEKYNINTCYKVLNKYGYSTGIGKTYKHVYGLV